MGKFFIYLLMLGILMVVVVRISGVSMDDVKHSVDAAKQTAQEKMQHQRCYIGYLVHSSSGAFAISTRTLDCNYPPSGKEINDFAASVKSDENDIVTILGYTPLRD